MLFVPLYPNAVAPDKIIDNLIRLLRDEQYQREALAWASPDEPLEPYTLVSESAVLRENDEPPWLLIKGANVESVDERPRLINVLRFGLYHGLAVPDGEDATDALMREAYRRNHAVFMMVLSAPKSELFKDMNVDMPIDIQVRRKNPSDTLPGASYERFPSLDVEIHFEESP